MRRIVYILWLKVLMFNFFTDGLPITGGELTKLYGQAVTDVKKRLLSSPDTILPDKMINSRNSPPLCDRAKDIVEDCAWLPGEYPGEYPGPSRPSLSLTPLDPTSEPELPEVVSTSEPISPAVASPEKVPEGPMSTKEKIAIFNKYFQPSMGKQDPATARLIQQAIQKLLLADRSNGKD
ncbi:hypothetical protein MMC07_005587 [Pseudocyphellaria aurata]|nr:hypothetical protein [Pseudocyphellaria aurata]